MRKFELLPHTADVRLLVTGSNLPELFYAALEGMNELLISNVKLQMSNDISEKITIKSTDQTALLIDFLSEVLAKTQIHKVIFDKVEFKKLKNDHLQVNIFGYKIDKFSEDIKAVTYHEAEVKKNKQGNWETILIFDI